MHLNSIFVNVFDHCLCFKVHSKTPDISPTLYVSYACLVPSLLGAGGGGDGRSVAVVVAYSGYHTYGSNVSRDITQACLIISNHVNAVHTKYRDFMVPKISHPEFFYLLFCNLVPNL